ncbi:hypothetical protein VTL71DRAFT_8201 [Oculimacula yallundae]|uniref:Uncharacterized protein n=1 Tax=Oculimacula yallundae TaxID=86028 RepID=A0ABR4CYF7_9HELO
MDGGRCGSGVQVQPANATQGNAAHRHEPGVQDVRDHCWGGTKPDLTAGTVGWYGHCGIACRASSGRVQQASQPASHTCRDEGYGSKWMNGLKENGEWTKINLRQAITSIVLAAAEQGQRLSAGSYDYWTDN